MTPSPLKRHPVYGSRTQQTNHSSTSVKKILPSSLNGTFKENSSSLVSRITPPPDPVNQEGQLALDVYQSPGEIIILAPIAGVKLSDINVSVTEDVLTIKGKRYLEFAIPEQDYLTQECFWGDFSRSIVLPASVDTTKISASFKDAVLKISIPRTERLKTKLIRIKAN